MDEQIQESFTIPNMKFHLPNHNPKDVIGRVSESGDLLFLTDFVFKYITGSKKWYIGYCSQQTASAICKRYKNGTLTTEKMIHLFNFYGFVKNELTWKKK